MDPQRIKHVFADALERTGRDRIRFLDGACGTDATLRAEVESLLSASDSSDALLGRPLLDDLDAALVPLREGPGTTIGNYRLLRQIGEGGFGVVFLAEQESPVRRQVALKVIKLGMDTRQVVARFAVERQALAMMEHPHIAKAIDAGATESGRPYFVTEFAAGEPITTFCDRHKLNVRNRLELFLLVCHALAHAHQKGIIHRDVKPGNVLVSVTDGKPTPKVIDFGVARSTQTSLLGATMATEARQIVGTLEYMSPEQADPAVGGVDTRGDIYSLGALLYELLAGAPPIDRTAVGSLGYVELLRIIREVEPLPPSVRRRRSRPAASSISRELDWVVMKCLEKDRERRYPGVAALAEDVERFLRDEPVLAGPHTAVYRFRKFVVRHKTGVAAAVLVILASAAAVTGTAVGFQRARAARWQAERNLDEARRESARAGAVTAFLGDVFSLAESGVGSGGEDASARDVLRRAAERIDVKLADRPQEQIVARRLLAHGCERMFLYDLAAEVLGKACEIAERRPTDLDEARRLDLRADWALAMYLARRGAEAAPQAKATVQNCRRALGEAHPVTWEAMQACALCMSQAGDVAQSYTLLKQLVEAARPQSAARRSSRLGRYLCNWSVALRDHGELDEAVAVLREAASILLDDLPEDSTAPATQPTDPWPLAERMFDPIEGGGWIAREMVEAGVPEATPLIEKYVQRALARHPQGTSSISFRLEDIANLRLRAGDPTGAAAAFARAIEISPKPRGADGGADATRWRMATLRCSPGLSVGWRSEALRAQMWCALDDLLRDHPPSRLAAEEMPLEQLKFKLLRWNCESDQAIGLAEGGLNELRAMEQPVAGTYLLGLEVPRLGDEPLRRADWLFLQPWKTTLRPVVRFDGIRTENTPNGQDFTGVLGAEPYGAQETFGLAMQDGLLGAAGAPRAQWFTAEATARVELRAGRYRISASSDDGVRVDVDGARAIDQWRPRPSGTSDKEIELSSGPHDLHVALLQETGGYCLRLQLAPMTEAAKTTAAALGGGVPEAEWKSGWYGQLRKDWPQDLRYTIFHARALAAAGRFREAADAYADTVERNPMDPNFLRAHAVLLSWIGDAEGCRRTARSLFDRFRGSSDPLTMAWVLICCGLDADLPVEKRFYRDFLARSEVVGVAPVDRPLLKLAQGVAHLRLQEPWAAAPAFQEALQWTPLDLPDRRAAAAAFLAMAHDRQELREEAQAAFARADDLIQHECPRAGVENVDRLWFEEWLLGQIAWREARAWIVDHNVHNPSISRP